MRSSQTEPEKVSRANWWLLLALPNFLGYVIGGDTVRSIAPGILRTWD